MEAGYRDLAKRMKIQDAARSLLDLGGGDGRLAIAIARKYSNLRHIVSGDISQDMTKRAKRRVTYANLSSTISAECLDMHALPYSNAQFDAVVSFGALHHARCPHAMLLEAHRVLRPGGYMCVIDGYDRPSFATIRKAISDLGGSFATAIAYWCGSKDCLSRDAIVSLVSNEGLPGITVVFDGLLATISGTKRTLKNEVLE